MSKIARTLGALVVAGAPFMVMTAPSAYAAAGCTVNNASTSTHGHVTIQAPPPTVSYSESSITCSYVTETGVVDWSCTLTGGRCEVTRSGGTGAAAACNAYGGVSCGGQIVVPAGSTVTLTVYGGSGSIADATV